MPAGGELQPRGAGFALPVGMLPPDGVEGRGPVTRPALPTSGPLRYSRVADAEGDSILLLAQVWR